jgi:site-specific DNA-methyltransferase (adenine-specific)
MMQERAMPVVLTAKHGIPFLNQIVEGDCRLLLRQLPDECIDVVVTSPPYYRQRDYGAIGIGNEQSLNEYLESLLEVFEQCVRCTKQTGSLFFIIGDKYEDGSLLLAPYLFAHQAIQRTGVKLINIITWVKPNPEPRQYRRRLVSSTEPIFHFVKSDAYHYYYERFMGHREMVRAQVKAGNNIGKRYLELIEQSDLSPEQKQAARQALEQVIAEVQRGEIASFRMKIRGIHSEAYGGYEGGRKSHLKSQGFTIIRMYDRAIKRDVIECPVIAVKSSNHPAVYPEFIVQELLNLTSQPNDVVLDPFIGSGTTAVVAKRMGRYYIGFEINPNYCEIARKRIEETPLQPNLLEFFV